MNHTITMGEFHRQDLLREAQRERLVKIARDAASPVRSQSSSGGGSPIDRFRSAVSRWAIGPTTSAFGR